MAQAVKHPTSAQVMISQFMSSSPMSGSVLTAQSLKLLQIYVSLTLCPFPAHTHSLSLSNISKTLKFKKKKGGDRKYGKMPRSYQQEVWSLVRKMVPGVPPPDGHALRGPSSGYPTSRSGELCGQRQKGWYVTSNIRLGYKGLSPALLMTRAKGGHITSSLMERPTQGGAEAAAHSHVSEQQGPAAPVKPSDDAAPRDFELQPPS